MVSEWFDKIGIIALLTELATRLMKKGGDVAEKKIDKALGIEIKEGGKDFTDEFLTNLAIQSLSDSDKKKIRELQDRLIEKDPAYNKAFVLAVAHFVEPFKVTKKNIDKSDPKNPIETSSNNWDVSAAVEFIRELLLEVGFEKQLNFLKKNRVFEEFAPEKTPTKKKLDEWKEKGKEKAKDFMEKERQQRAVEEDSREEQEGEESWDKRFLARSKERYEQSKRRR